MIYRWTQVTDQAPFAPRDGAGALVHDGKMWLLGGWNPRDKVHFPNVCNSEVWCSEDGLDWELITPAAPWEGRHTAGYAIHEGAMWVIGGDVIQGHSQDDVWKSVDGRQWECVCRRVPWSPRALHYTVAFRGRLWVIGGQTLPDFAPHEERFYHDVWSSEDGRQWEKAADELPWGPRGMIGGSVVLHDRLWLLGGGTYDTPLCRSRRFYRDVWSSPDGIRWECRQPHAPWAARQYHDVAVFDQRMWVLEGYAEPGGNRNDVWYSEDGVQWHELPGTPWAPRHAASLFVHREALWIVTGNNLTSDVWKLERIG